MKSKLRAARLATVAGESVVMANGSRDGILDAIFRCEPVGTLFLPQRNTMPAWKRWLGFAAMPKGRLVVDAGARTAVERDGRSLLPIGVVQVEGTFGKGDVVSLCGPDGAEFARGLTNYAAAAAERLRGLRSEQLREALGGDAPYAEVVHRDNLVVTG
jgi:glutamate 5-kinase